MPQAAMGNEEFDLGLGPDELAGLGDGKDLAAKRKGGKGKTVFIDPEDDRENWPVIRIESEDQRPNYEFVSVQGTKKDGTSFAHDLQIMREVDVAVPPSIVYCLRDAVAAHFVPTINPATGKKELRRQNRSSIPWRLVKGGKYC